jgi:F0F1-type ATP synthase assembly protein I
LAARQPLAYVGLGFELVVPVVLLICAGHWLDGRLATRGPWFTVTGALLGIAVGFYGFYRRVLSSGRGGDGTRA